MSFFSDFKKFAMRGNVMDMAVGVIIGGAFGKIVSSFVSDVIMPPIGMLLGNVDFSNLFINLSSTPAATLAEATEAGLPVIAYGQFINSVIDFLIQALVIFTMIRQMNKLVPPPAPAPAIPMKKCPFCYSEIDKRSTRCPHCGGSMDAKDEAKE